MNVNLDVTKNDDIMPVRERDERCDSLEISVFESVEGFVTRFDNFPGLESKDFPSVFYKDANSMDSEVSINFKYQDFNLQGKIQLLKGWKHNIDTCSSNAIYVLEVWENQQEPENHLLCGMKFNFMGKPIGKKKRNESTIEVEQRLYLNFLTDVVNKLLAKYDL